MHIKSHPMLERLGQTARRRPFRVIMLLAGSILITSMIPLAARENPALAQPLATTQVFLPGAFKNSDLIIRPPLGEYIVIGWNDLGMHCYDFDYTDMAVLPPFNNLWAQVIKRGDPPQVITQGVKVNYSFKDNSESASKTNFWDHAQALFGVSLAPNIGLAGKGMSGEMDLAGGDHFQAIGVPITEYRDSAPTVPYYFQLANLVLTDAVTGQQLSTTPFVAPISSEMRCFDCHTEPYTNFRWNILKKHDDEEGTNLMSQRPVLCANCHADPALGKPGKPGVLSLSAAMHGKHAEEGAGPGDCYACHPGPKTRCLRDVMSQSASQIWCTDCHGHLADLGQSSRQPWVDEPRCANCHQPKFAENTGKLYRHSTGHGGLYCESCHNSTHAILTSREQNDNLQSLLLQGYAGTIQECTVCHLTQPATGSIHP